MKNKYYLSKEGSGSNIIKSIKTDEEVVYNENKEGKRIIYPKEVKALASYHTVSSWVSTIIGKVLTIIDAPIPNDKQNKAIKDIIQNEVYDFLYKHIYEMFDGNKQAEMYLKEDLEKHGTTLEELEKKL